jgi:zinc transport system substrate-binding protein
MIRSILVIFFFSVFGWAKSSVCVSIPPQAYFVKKIAGDKADITVLIPPGASPATYSPKPSQLRAIKKASLYFTIGVPFEKNWLERFKSINPKLKIVDMTQDITKIPMQNHLDHDTEQHGHDSHGHHAHAGLDPHVWLSPALVEKIAEVIKETFIKEDPKNSAFYRQNYQNFLREIEEIRSKIAKILSGLKQKEFIVFHPSFGYFCEEFGLKQVAIEKEGKEPSLRYMKRLIDFAKKHGIKTIFVEPQFSQKSARYIAKAIGGKVQSIDPLAYDWERNIMEIAKSFEKAD